MEEKTDDKNNCNCTLQSSVPTTGYEPNDDLQTSATPAPTTTTVPISSSPSTSLLTNDDNFDKFNSSFFDKWDNPDNFEDFEIENLNSTLITIINQMMKEENLTEKKVIKNPHGGPFK